MADLATVLLGLISIGITIIGLVLGYLLREMRKIRNEELRPMKENVDTLWISYFGGEDDGRQSVRQLVNENAQQQDESHKQVERNTRMILSYMRTLVRCLRSQGLDAPSPDEEIDEDELYRGGSSSADD